MPRSNSDRDKTRERGLLGKGVLGKVTCMQAWCPEGRESPFQSKESSPHNLPRERKPSVWGCLLGPGHPRLELSSDLGILKKQMGLTWVSPAPLSHILVCHLLCAISRTFLGASRSLEGFTRCNCQAGSQPSLLCTQHEAETENTSFAASPAGNAPKGGQAVSIASFPAHPGP